jgi:predicted lipid-binding transport protein (Tim44 family)
MTRKRFPALRACLPFLLLALILASTFVAFGDVGNQNRYTPGSGGSSGDGDIGVLIGYLLGLFIENPTLGLIVLVILIIFVLLRRRKNKKLGSDSSYINQQVQQQAQNDVVMNFTESVAAQVRQTDPDFSAEKFLGWAQEVFMKIQEAWTTRDWKVIRPFESETLFNTHKQQLDEYIRLGKINVIEKIGIKHCSLKSYTVDGDKEVMVVALNALLRDYVIDATTRNVLESDPNRDWYMKYELTFNRKVGVKTHPGMSNMSTTNCPNCGAPTEITSAGQCPYCGSVITNGEHDWVLSNLVGVNQ